METPQRIRRTPWVIFAVMTHLPAADHVALLVAVGLACGAVAGGILGLLSGAACAWMVTRFLPRGFAAGVSSPVPE